jgi:HlyD family secretion protein
MVKKLFILLIILLIIGFGGFYFYQGSNPQEVSYVHVQQADYVDKILTTGTVLLEGLTEIKTEVSGKIVALEAVEGDEVKQGQTLLRFETIDVYLDLKQAEASYTLAKSRYDEIVNTTCPTSQEQYRQAQLAMQELQEKVIRYERLYSQKAIAQDRLEEARHQLELQQSTTEIQKKFMESCAEGGAKRETALAEMKSAQARIDLLKNRLDKHTILSPINGIIIEQYKSLGEYAMLGENLYTLAEKNSKYIEIELDERNIPLINLNQPVFVSTEFSSENRIEGKISYIAPSVDPNKGTVKIKVKLIGENEYLIKNMTVRCEIVYAEYPASLVIPQEYLVSDEGNYFIFSILDRRVEKRSVMIDNPNAKEIRIIEGVKLNEIILNPAGLEDGMEVVLKD